MKYILYILINIILGATTCIYSQVNKQLPNTNRRTLTHIKK
jgi:hypothetical protein